MTYLLGIDIGGTFTDGVLLDEDTGAVRIEKVLTTPADLAEAFMDTVDALTSTENVSASSLNAVMHASTIATNALLQHRGVKVGLLVTAGFRDILEIGRQVRHELYNVFTTKPPPLVPRRYALEIRERLDYRGDVVRELVDEDVVAAAEFLKSRGVDSIAICFLHSYKNAIHEQRAAEIVRNVHPAAALSVSSAIAPEIKEYWRASTTCVNAYIGPVVRQYLDRVVDGLVSRNFVGEVGIMHSGGGIAAIGSVRDQPFQMIESGPAAGIAAAGHFARKLGYDRALSFDMGGTTAKAGLIVNGTSRVLSEFEVAGSGRSGSSVTKASGYPVIGEVVDLVEVGAGGGSIAWLDAGGHLRVGPQGAGAHPGPACYGLGGKAPTITDANLVLGLLDPDYFLGGGIRLSAAAAEEAIRTVCAEPLGMSVEEAASGIVEIANATMVSALRLISVERGHDPREFCLIAFGGAGPVHAASLAATLEIPVVLVLPNPGVASAWGLLVSDVKHDVRATNVLLLVPENVAAMRAAYQDLSTRMQEQLDKEPVTRESFELVPYAETRYVGQSSRLRLHSITTADSDEYVVSQMTAQFHAEHEREFGFSVPGEAIEIVTLGVTAVAARSTVIGAAGGAAAHGDPLKGRRSVYFSELGERVTTPIFNRERLAPGQSLEGPAIIEEFDSSTVVRPGFTAEVLDTGVLCLQSSGREPCRY